MQIPRNAIQTKISLDWISFSSGLLGALGCIPAVTGTERVVLCVLRHVFFWHLLGGASGWKASGTSVQLGHNRQKNHTSDQLIPQLVGQSLLD